MTDYPTTEDGDVDREQILNDLALDVPLYNSVHFETEDGSHIELDSIHDLEMQGRLDGYEWKYELPQFYIDYMNGEVNEVDVETVNPGEVVVNRLELAELVDYVGSDIETYGDTIPEEVRDAFESLRDELGGDHA